MRPLRWLTGVVWAHARLGRDRRSSRVVVEAVPPGVIPGTDALNLVVSPTSRHQAPVDPRCLVVLAINAPVARSPGPHRAGYAECPGVVAWINPLTVFRPESRVPQTVRRGDGRTGARKRPTPVVIPPDRQLYVPSKQERRRCSSTRPTTGAGGMVGPRVGEHRDPELPLTYTQTAPDILLIAKVVPPAPVADESNSTGFDPALRVTAHLSPVFGKRRMLVRVLSCCTPGRMRSRAACSHIAATRAAVFHRWPCLRWWKSPVPALERAVAVEQFALARCVAVAPRRGCSGPLKWLNAAAHSMIAPVRQDGPLSRRTWVR